MASYQCGDGDKPDGLTLRSTSAARIKHAGLPHDKTTDAMSVAGTYDGKDVAPRGRCRKLLIGILSDRERQATRRYNRQHLRRSGSSHVCRQHPRRCNAGGDL